MRVVLVRVAIAKQARFLLVFFFLRPLLLLHKSLWHASYGCSPANLICGQAVTNCARIAAFSVFFHLVEFFHHEWDDDNALHTLGGDFSLSGGFLSFAPFVC